MFAFLLVFLLYLLLSIFITFPLVFHLGNLATGLGDELVLAWIHNWVIHAVTTGQIFSLFEANTYYPFHNSLAFSDLFIPASLFAYLPLLIVKEAIVVNNFNLIFSITVLGFSIYLLTFYITKNYFASILSGLLVIFSPAVLDKIIHLQILSIQWVPLALLFFLNFLDSKKSRYLMLSFLFFVIQTYNSFMPGYFILFSYVVIGLFYSFYHKKKLRALITRNNIILLLLSFTLIVPIVIPYYKVSQEFNYVRDIRETIHFALQPEDMLYSSDKSRLHSFINSLPFNQRSQNDEFKPGYLGFIFSVLAFFAVYYCIKHFRKGGFFRNSFFSISLIGLVLSLGPFLHLGRQTIHHPFPIPLPYAVFYYLAPGFQGFS